MRPLPAFRLASAREVLQILAADQMGAPSAINTDGQRGFAAKGEHCAARQEILLRMVGSLSQVREGGRFPASLLSQVREDGGFSSLLHPKSLQDPP